MYKPSELFHKCWYDVKYETAPGDTDYAFLAEKNTLYIYFKGSDSDSDWKDNFNFPKKPYHDMAEPYYVHRGFLKQWKAVQEIIINKITEKNTKGNFKWTKIIVVGYSLGGAIAQFCHECVWYHRPDLREDGLEGYGFEAPRIMFTGWLGFKHVKPELAARWAKFKIYRNYHDIVTHCPPTILFGYRHATDNKVIKIHGDRKLSGAKWYIPGFVKDHYWNPVEDGLKKIEK